MTTLVTREDGPSGPESQARKAKPPARTDTFVVRNQTPSRLEITNGTHTLKLAPLQQVRVGYDPCTFLGTAAQRAATDRAVAWEREPVRSTRVWATAWLSLFALLGLCVTGVLLLFGPTWLAAGMAGVGTLACIAAIVVVNDDPPELEQSEVGLGQVPRHHTGWQFTKDVAVSTAQKIALLFVLAAGILAPTAAIYYGTELSTVLQITDWPPSLVTDASSRPVVVARLLQIVLVVTLALIPGLMYFQFDREKLTTLIDRWVHHAFRLDPTLHTMADLDAKYGRRVEEFYGATFDAGVATVKKRTTSRSPLVVATLLLAVGWIVALLNSPVDLAVQGQALVQDGRPKADLPSIQRFIQPAYTPMTCAFLGAYFFSLQLVLLGYVRGDLRPKTYNVVAVRVLVAVILGWMLQGLVGGSPTWVLAASFLGGLVPDTVLRLIRDLPSTAMQKITDRRASKNPDVEVIDEFEDRSPLIALDGIGIYERTRLAEEGITSVQALARHDLVDLMLSSRIPASRLIDWVDQALLFQHVTAADRRALRKAGVRTATELLNASRLDGSREKLVKQLQDGEDRLPLILAALEGDEWLTYVQHWRDHDDTEEPGRTCYRREGLTIEAPTPGPHRHGDGYINLTGRPSSADPST